MTATPLPETFPEDALTQDGFLGGRLRIWQPRAGYRAATDPVILAAACDAQAGDRVLELGCGAGVASLCLAHRVAGLSLTGVERQPAYADLARRNAALAGVAMEVVTADLAHLPKDLRGAVFDHVIANPPYFAPHSGTPARDHGREQAQREDTPLALWIETARRRLRPKGWLTLIHLTERLPDILAALKGFGSITIRPLAARQGQAAGRVVLRARKSGRGNLTLLPPFILHEGAAHDGDRDSYGVQARAVLRDGADLSMDATAIGGFSPES